MIDGRGKTLFMLQRPSPVQGNNDHHGCDSKRGRFSHDRDGLELRAM